MARKESTASHWQLPQQGEHDCLCPDLPYHQATPFRPTTARYHALHGLQFREGDGPWLKEDTKIVLLDAGVVLLIDFSGAKNFPVQIPEGLIDGVTTINGTRDPVALELARRRSRQELPYKLDGSWVEIELPDETVDQLEALIQSLEAHRYAIGVGKAINLNIES